ncbi:MAG: threonine synthase [Saprospiraceae bacterium]|nr:threonine synthase [Saprospiraceae bacterium]
MKLFSTNNPNKLVDLKEAVLNAFPEDRGLYWPTEIPLLRSDFLSRLAEFSFNDIAFEVSNALIQGTIPEKDLIDIIENSIRFPAPVVGLSDDLNILELFHGPTMAFKDFGARFMAQLMSYFTKGSDRKTTILVATSGDTGGAVASGFFNAPGIEVIILYPSGKISPLQEQQLTTWGNNIKAVEVNGVFDDCQALVKQAFLDKDLKSRYTFSSANSINIARLIPQSFYYFEAYKQLDRNKSNIFVVPSGNFGNLTAGLLAQKMGLDIHSFVAAINSNKTFLDYIDSGVYEARPSVPTVSNAMDVGDPSNFPRLLNVSGSTWNMVKSNIRSYSFTDSQTIEAIKAVYNTYHYTIDPHGAVGYLAYLSDKEISPYANYTVLETAHPGKFSEIVNKAIPEKIIVPEALRSFMDKPKEAFNIQNNYKEFKSLLMHL